ncbi:MAG: hypothetical protein WDM79_06190 [Terricaulis sp.]
MDKTPALLEQQEAAVIDVGSNSVRLVVYRIDGRAMTPILNEKVMAGLGRDLTRGGALSVEGVDIAIKALRRFATLIKSLDVPVFAVATAAVRKRAMGAPSRGVSSARQAFRCASSPALMRRGSRRLASAPARRMRRAWSAILAARAWS